MDVKVYKKEEVKQPQGSGFVYVPDVIDIIPTVVELEEDHSINNNIWSLGQLQRIADVQVRNGKLIINSDKVTYKNGNLYVSLRSEQIVTCETVDGNAMLEQQCALATIFQRGLDPLDKNDGIRWSEAILGELSALQLIQDITEAVAKVSSAVQVTFDTVEDDKGNSYLSYKLTEVV